jgi:hypothetical protein
VSASYRHKIVRGNNREPLDFDDGVDAEDGCVLCGGPIVPLGTLGNTEYARCQACGMPQSRRVVS